MVGLWSLGEEAGQVAVAAVVADVVVVASIVVCVQVALAGKVVLVAMPASAGLGWEGCAYCCGDVAALRSFVGSPSGMGRSSESKGAWLGFRSWHSLIKVTSTRRRLLVAVR